MADEKKPQIPALRLSFPHVAEPFPDVRELILGFAGVVP